MSRKLSQVSGAEKERTTKNLRLLFETYRGSSPGIEAAGLVRLADECALLDAASSGLTAEKCALIFSRVKLGKKTELNLNRFEEACRQLAVEKGTTFTELVANCSRIKGIGEGEAAGKEVDASTLSIREIKKLLTEQGIDFSQCVEKSEMVALLKRSGAQAKVTGLAALRYSAMEMLQSVDESEYEVQYTSKRSLGISLERANEWGVVKVAPAEVEIGSVLTRVNDGSVLNKTYAEAMTALKHASWPLTMRFRRSPTKSGVLWKRSRGRTGAARNWKRRYVVLTSGIFEYFTKEPEKGGELKGQYVLENDPGSQTMVTMAPEAIMGAGEHGIMIVKGDDRLVLKADSYADLVDWGAKLYYAVALANGGNPEMMAHEEARLAVIESERAAEKWAAESKRLNEEAAAKVAQHHAEEERLQALRDAAASAADKAALDAQLAEEKEKAAAEEAEAEAALETQKLQAEADERDRLAAIEAARKEAEEAESKAAEEAEAAVLALDAADGVASITVDDVEGGAAAAGGADDKEDEDEDEDDNVPEAVAMAAKAGGDTVKASVRASMTGDQLAMAAAAAQLAEEDLAAEAAEAAGEDDEAAEAAGADAEAAPAAEAPTKKFDGAYAADDSWFSM